MTDQPKNPTDQPNVPKYQDHLYLYTDIQEQVEETELYYKIIFYPPAARYLVFYFEIPRIKLAHPFRMGFFVPANLA